MRTRGALIREMGAPPPYAESRPIEIVEAELDPPGPGEVLIRVRAAGVCHSDLSVVNGSRPRVMPMVLGHEAAGEVVEAGPGVASASPGDHVVLAFVPACGECGPCHSGRAALCERGAAANADGTLLSGERRLREPGGEELHHHLGVSAFSDHIVVSERSVVRIDRSLPFQIAALFGCAVLTGVGAVTNSAQVRPGDTVSIFGLGGVGMAALLGAVLSGAGQIAVSDPIPQKLELALELGATEAFPAGPDCVAEIREATRGGADHVIETVGNAAVLAEAYAATRRGGQTVTVGLPHPDAELRLQAVSLVAEERTLRGSYLGSCVPARDIPRFVELHLAGKLPVDRLLSHTIALEDLNDAFDRLTSGEALRQVVVFPDT